MIPVTIATTAAKGLKNTAKAIKNNISKDVVLLIVVVAVVVFAAKKGKDIYNKIKENGVDNNENESNTIYAHRFYNALHSGAFGLFEDETALYNLAQEIGKTKVFNDVAKVYKAKYQKALGEQLAIMLSSSELAKFYNHLA